MSRLQRRPALATLDPAGLHEQPCQHCGNTHWILEQSAIDRSAWRIRCALPVCRRVLVAAHLPVSDTTGHIPELHG